MILVARLRIPPWAWAAAGISTLLLAGLSFFGAGPVFVFGLTFLLVREREEMQINIDDHGAAHTIVTAKGDALLDVVHLLDRLMPRQEST